MPIISFKYSVSFGDEDTEFTVYCKDYTTAMCAFNALQKVHLIVYVQDEDAKIVQRYDNT